MFRNFCTFNYQLLTKKVLSSTRFFQSIDDIAEKGSKILKNWRPENGMTMNEFIEKARQVSECHKIEKSDQNYSHYIAYKSINKFHFVAKETIQMVLKASDTTQSAQFETVRLHLRSFLIRRIKCIATGQWSLSFYDGDQQDIIERENYYSTNLMNSMFNRK